MTDPIIPPLSAEEAERLPLEVHDTIPEDVRQKVAALRGRLESIARVLGASSALPRKKRDAKDELRKLSKEALALWSLI